MKNKESATDWAEYTKATGKPRTFSDYDMQEWKKKRDAGRAVLRGAPKEDLMSKLKGGSIAKELRLSNIKAR